MLVLVVVTAEKAFGDENGQYRAATLIPPVSAAANDGRYRPSDDGRYRPANDGSYSHVGDGGRIVGGAYSGGGGAYTGGGGKYTGTSSGTRVKTIKITPKPKVSTGSGGAQTSSSASGQVQAPKPKVNSVTIGAVQSNRGSVVVENLEPIKIIRQEQSQDEEGYRYL